MKNLRWFFFAIDFGFLANWAITALHLIPREYLYQDYTNGLVVVWNWSFAPLAIVVSVTGLWSLVLWKKQDVRYRRLALVSLALTTATGFQAISYWAFKGEFDLLWWAPNLFLLIYPWFFLVPMLRNKEECRSGG